MKTMTRIIILLGLLSASVIKHSTLLRAEEQPKTQSDQSADQKTLLASQCDKYLQYAIAHLEWYKFEVANCSADTRKKLFQLFSDIKNAFSNPGPAPRQRLYDEISSRQIFNRFPAELTRLQAEKLYVLMLKIADLTEMANNGTLINLFFLEQHSKPDAEKALKLVAQIQVVYAPFKIGVF